VSFPTLPPIADSLGSAIRLLEEALDAEMRRSLRRTTESTSGILRMKRHLDMSVDSVRAEAVADALSRVFGYRKTTYQLQGESRARVDSPTIVAEEDAKVKRLAEREADKAARKARAS
jgi:hypothetical protein